MKKAVISFAEENKLTCVYGKEKQVDGIYGCYNLLNVSLKDGEKGSVITLHNNFKKVDALEADLKKFGFIESVSVDARGNAVIGTLDKKYSLKQDDYKWIFDTALEFVKRFDLRIGDCESCGRAGASFFRDAKTGAFYNVCENCLENVGSGFNKERGEKKGFWASIARFFRGKKTHKNLVRLEGQDTPKKK